MTITKKQILLFFLFIFAIYCALTIGQSWDEKTGLLIGETTLNFLFSFGALDNEILYRENYSPIYWSLLYLITQMFPSNYEIEVSHLVNLFFSILTIFGVRKLCKELFNDKIGKLAFLILFFYPIFFGHMGFNNKDTILAFSHIWITYFLFLYIKKQNIKDKANKYIAYIAILTAVATGIQLVFIGSLIPIVLFVFLEIFFFKKLIDNNFSIKKLLLDLLKCFILFYLLLILFWIDTFSNIFTLPLEIVVKTLSSEYWTGWPFNLFNGDFFISAEVPKSYFLINLIFKSPEYFLLCYLFFIFLFISSRKFFVQKLKFFNYKLFLIIMILIFPNFILLVAPYPVYDGLRLFLWTLPYFCIIPAMTIYYLIENINFIKSKLAFSILSIFIVFFLYNFFSITPYQYTYLNILNGKNENKYKKFENDYWGASVKELIKKTDFSNINTLKISTCGVSVQIVKKYFQNKKYSNVEFVSIEDADYIIMTNRVTYYDLKAENIILATCFDKFKGNDLFNVKRNDLVLSVIRKI